MSVVFDEVESEIVRQPVAPQQQDEERGSDPMQVEQDFKKEEKHYLQRKLRLYAD